MSGTVPRQPDQVGPLEKVPSLSQPRAGNEPIAKRGQITAKKTSWHLPHDERGSALEIGIGKSNCIYVFAAPEAIKG